MSINKYNVTMSCCLKLRYLCHCWFTSIALFVRTSAAFLSLVNCNNAHFRSCPRGGPVGDRDPGRWGVCVCVGGGGGVRGGNDLVYLALLHFDHRNDSALRWATMRDILLWRNKVTKSQNFVRKPNQDSTTTAFFFFFFFKPVYCPRL